MIGFRHSFFLRACEARGALLAAGDMLLVARGPCLPGIAVFRGAVPTSCLLAYYFSLHELKSLEVGPLSRRIQ